jgi:zinc protease
MLMQRNLLRWTYLLLLQIFTLHLFAQFNANQILPLDPKVKIGKLPNGLTYYIQKNSKPEKKVELRLVVNVGSVLEDNEQLGLAHFMEHMGFNGSKNFPKNELVNYLQKVGVKFGADLNAYTSFDETVYILPVSTEDPEVVEKGFTVLEDWAFNNLLDKNEIDKERGVVLEESRLSKGSGERMRRQYFPVLFNGSLYADRLPIGKDSILKNFKFETLQRFYKTWYRPNLMAVVVVGDLDPAVAEQKIKAHFGKFNNPATAKTRPSSIPIKNWTKPQAIVVTDDEATNTVVQIFNFVKPSKKIKTWGDYREKLKEDLITSLISQRLQELTQKENPPFIYGYTGYTQLIRGYESFISYAVIGNNPAQEAVDALITETERARKFGFLGSEIERAKANLMNSAERAYNERDKSESGSLVWNYVNNFLEGTPIPGVQNRYEFLKKELSKITVDELNALAKQMPPTTNAFALMMAPTKQKDKLPDNESLQKQLVAALSKPVTPYEEKIIAGKLFETEPTPGKISSETKNEKLGTINYTLNNGITIAIKPTTLKNDQIVMDAWRWGGFHQFDISDKENAQYSATLVTQMGVKDLSGSDLQKFLSGKTVSVHPYVNPHEEGIEGSCGVKDFETFLQLTHLYFTQPRKDESIFKSYVTKQKASVQNIRLNPRLFYQDTLTKIVYKNNPWAVEFPTAQEFDRLSLDGAMAGYKKMFDNAHGMHFTFVGNINPETIKPLLEKYLGSLPAKEKENKYKDNGVRPVRGITEVNIQKGKESQSFISLVFDGEAEYTSKDNLAMKALMEILNIKVVEKLREEMSGIYGGGFSGGYIRRPYSHYKITASVPCGPDNVNKLTTALIGLIEGAKKNIDDNDLNKVKQTWKKQYATSVQDNYWWLFALSGAWIDRNDPEELVKYVEAVDALKPEDIQKAAIKFFDLNNYVKAVLYPEGAEIKEPEKKAF